MTLILCVDDRGGLSFNGRRQSQDRRVREDLLTMAAGGALWMDDYSRRQFTEPEAAAIRVDRDPAAPARGPARRAAPPAPAGRNDPPDSGAANTIFRSILSCLSLNFAKNRFSRKIGFRQKTSAFFRKTREISVFIAKKQRCFSENVLFFFTFSEKISISEYQPHGKELPLLPKNKIHCAGAVNPNLSGVVFLGFRCCFG